MATAAFQSKILRRKAGIEEYRIYRAALEWDLVDPIVIEKREDIRSEQLWRNRLEPYHHQVSNLITFCRRLPVTLLADDVGLGKTISAGLIISELMARSRLSKILIVCPKILGSQWKEELLTKFNIFSDIITGKNLRKADPDETGAIITTYDSARMYLESIPKDRFQMLVLDEAHKLRNLYGVDKPPKVAICFRKALEERRFRFVLMLTATPIQNRLWDLYSLVDLLTVARGHQNPFGDEGTFARRFIADGSDQARRLKLHAQDEFRSIVYGYMSRVRRNDAKLYFPDRIVQMHRVDPTVAELQLIDAIAKPIQCLKNKLAQISILQALTSSPEALLAQLKNMARNGTVPSQLAETVNEIVVKMPASAKLNGLGRLIDGLRQENPAHWRLVIFTGRRETQTTIQTFLEKHGLKVGTINGESGPRDQDTLARFRKKPPNCHVIISTEKGAEGINLQVANVLVNYDLPWNPMIVEQRIGRIQRLASEHANVSIFNVMLRGTFEEYIVGRLMEKLQMASHAIGDIEALLEASGIGGDNDNGTTSFEEKIRQLVIAALAGKDVEAATRKEEESISEARKTLELEEENINSLLGGMDGTGYVGPRTPTLPSTTRSMEPKEFALAALGILGARITPKSPDLYFMEEDGRREYIRFNEISETGIRSTLYAPSTPAFTRLVERIIATGIHDIKDVDQDPRKVSAELIRSWAKTFGGSPDTAGVAEVLRVFEGKALVRVRATVAHDSYERLVEIPCSPTEHQIRTGRPGLDPLPSTIDEPASIGVNLDRLADAAKLDEGISEFRRFYLERRAEEIKAAEGDERKRKKLEDDFTPRLEMTLVALEGNLHRQLKLKIKFKIDPGIEFSTILTVDPHLQKILDKPELALCERSGKNVPQTCLKQCEISKRMALPNFLVQSEVSHRLALPEYTLRCHFSGKLVLKDEVEISAVTGLHVASNFLKTSAQSGKRAEPNHFGRCEFTNAEVLNTELAVSQMSGKRYRSDEQLSSGLSGKTGHKSEFVFCHETRQPLMVLEAEKCEVTGKYVRPGILEECAITRKRVLSSELERCSASGEKALQRFLVTSSLSGARILERVTIRSMAGNFCSPLEAKPCFWSGRKSHIDDLRLCELTGLPIHIEFATSSNKPKLQPLVELLSGIRRTADATNIWDDMAAKIGTILGKNRCRIEATVYSPGKRHLAVCCEVRTLLGFKIQHSGFIYAIEDKSIIGNVVLGKRTSKGWSD
ncbi:MAG: DEAD/DEAH box helicase [Candidatus Tectomicrobia bacterium]|uniref:DEAD/DEAH box helicase n=1 Tax=Tectimicrobiota bacterium TaxID=2528274 RepID=A0A932HZ87_UNCTE|nr:DEAD/DEAH box helicase [Candidatus Tectomicrobia bacterium]